MSFSGLEEDDATWSFGFSASARTMDLLKTLTNTVEIPDRPAQLSEDAIDAQAQAQTQVRATTVQENESRNTRFVANWR